MGCREPSGNNAKDGLQLGKPRLLSIHFHTLRHWKSTMEYAKKESILHVKQLLDLKNFENTLKYTQTEFLKMNTYAKSRKY